VDDDGNENFNRFEAIKLHPPLTPFTPPSFNFLSPHTPSRNNAIVSTHTHSHRLLAGTHKKTERNMRRFLNNFSQFFLAFEMTEEGIAAERRKFSPFFMLFSFMMLLQ
jgi:hypothetical protein